MRAEFIYSSQLDLFKYPPECPFKTERARLTREILLSMGRYTDPDQGIVECAPQSATPDELLLFHSPEYLKVLGAAAGGELTPQGLAMGLATPETPVFAGMYEYAALAAGGTLTGAKHILQNSADTVFNPSGGYHHAKKAAAGGFCYINDVVLAARLLANAGKRVVVLDLDAHHGNGTQEAFYAEESVFTISLHESGETLYPWGGAETETGEGRGCGYNVNIPLPAGTDDDAFFGVFKEVVMPLLGAYNPDVILLEIGMDILAIDPLTHLSMTNNVIADTLPLITALAKPLLVTGGGGYNPQATARGWALVWSILCGHEVAEDLSLGMGGVFLGSSEWAAGLRDMHSYATGDDAVRIKTRIAQTTAWIKENIFPIHKI
jgi:acetoin utilization protein AcuC